MPPIRTGTSGFSFPGWYPPCLPANRRLSCYETQHGLRVVEINSSFYTLLSRSSVEGLLRGSGPDFRFVLKLHHALTHNVGQFTSDVITRFRVTVEMFRESGKLLGVLAQFPPRLQPTPTVLRYLWALRGYFGDVRFFSEFRNRSWSGVWLREQFRKHDVGLCVPDLPPLRPFPRFKPEATTDTAYFRLHGRNPDWYGTPEARYDWRYSDEELTEFREAAESLGDRVRETFVFFNNCRQGEALRNAKRFKELLSKMHVG